MTGSYGTLTAKKKKKKESKTVGGISDKIRLNDFSFLIFSWSLDGPKQAGNQEP